MSTKNEACEVPLTEQLRYVERTRREMVEVGYCAHRNIPYGELYYRAADEIDALRAESAALKAELAEARKDSARLDWLQGAYPENMDGRTGRTVERWFKNVKPITFREAIDITKEREDAAVAQEARK